MAEQTEAACLIDAGAMYKRRAGLRAPDGRVVFAGFKPGAFALFDDDAPFYHFDRDGRWQRALVDGIHYLKGLDGRAIALDRTREGAHTRLHRRTLSFAEVNDLDAAIRSAAIDLIADVCGGRRRLIAPSRADQTLDADDLLEMLERIGRWDSAAWFRHRERYLDTYGPLPILPPDAQQSAVFQATMGHPGPRAFGGGPAETHHVLDPDEFADHVEKVLALLGRRREQAATAFLAGADFLRQDRAWVLACLDRVRDRLARRPADATAWKGAMTFLDDFPTGWMDAEFAQGLVDHGLIRLVLGIESEDRRTWDDQALIDGLNHRPDRLALSVLTLARADDPAEALDATAGLLRQPTWKAGDSVFVLDASEIDPDLPAIAPDRFDQRVAALKAALADRRVKVLPYSVG